MFVATLSSVTVAPGTTAPDWSVMVPLIDAVATCACTLAEQSVSAVNASAVIRIVGEWNCRHKCRFRKREYVMVTPSFSSFLSSRNSVAHKAEPYIQQKTVKEAVLGLPSSSTGANLTEGLCLNSR